jgi:hypothetical protein
MMWKYVTLFVLLCGFSSPSWAQESSDTLEQLSGQFSLALDKANLSPEQAQILIGPYKDLIAGLELYSSQQQQAAQQSQQTQKQAQDLSGDSASVWTSLKSERQARQRELLFWQIGTWTAASAATGALGYLLYLGISGHIHP